MEGVSWERLYHKAIHFAISFSHLDLIFVLVGKKMELVSCRLEKVFIGSIQSRRLFIKWSYAE